MRWRMVTSGWPQATRSPQTGWNQKVDDWDSWHYHCYLTTNQSEGPWAIMHLKTLCLVFKNPSLKATRKFTFFFFLSVSCPFSLLGVLILLQRLLSRVWLYGTSLVVQSLRIHLLMLGTWVNPWSRKIPHAMEQLSPHALGPVYCNTRSHQMRSPHIKTRQ